MIAENREQVPTNEIHNILQDYLRTELSDASNLNNASIQNGLIERCAIKAKDYCLRRGINLSDIEASRLAQEAVETYKQNWYNKVQGTDNRSGNLGKIFSI
jgi:hypothetical protein